MDQQIEINNIAQVHKMFGLDKPQHPLISIVNINDKLRLVDNVRVNLQLFSVSLKFGVQASCLYGRNNYDFADGTLVFTAPGQVMTYSAEDLPDLASQGWTLLFHPDLIRKSELKDMMGQYSFFHYDSSEALHLSEAEKQLINDVIGHMQLELEQQIDAHSDRILVSNIRTIMDYSLRFFERQFHTRQRQNKDVISRLEQFLIQYYSSDKQETNGLPSVSYCGKELGISPYYLSDLLKSETGKNATDHIHNFILDKAKSELLGSQTSVTDIAYRLGFSYPQHFSKLFKAKTGLSPSQFRQRN